uniref:TNFL4 factor n=1 Tax=Amazona collaria TaxID=241587 RepID=A0A8B9FH20_9PSIT
SFILSSLKKKQTNQPREMFSVMLPASPQKALFLILPALNTFCMKQPISKKAFVIMGPPLLSYIPGKSIKGVAMNFTTEVGTIQIKNGSIMINCDGLYLVSLKGFITDLEEGDLLKLTLQKTDKRNSRPLWEQTAQGREYVVNLITVLFLFEKDNITLLTNSSATISHLSFSLVLQSPLNCSHLQS